MAGQSLIFIGNERLATAVTTTAPIFRALILAGYKFEAVVASHEDAISRQKRDLEIGQVAQAHNIPVILPGSEIPLVDKLRKHPATAAILAAYGQVVPQAVIDLFPRGIINIHPSLLPKLRGPTPIETAILEGSLQTGVSLMKLEAGLDTGPVYAQKKTALNGTETKPELSEKLGQLGAELLIKHLPDILSGALIPKPQTGHASFSQKITKAGGKIDWSKPASQLEREIRAYAGWPGSYTKLAGKDVSITQAKIYNLSGTPGDIFVAERQNLGVYCGKNALTIERIKPAGKKEMTGQEFTRGYLR